MARSERGVFLALVLLAMFIVTRGPGSMRGDAPHALALSDSLARDGDFDLGNQYAPAGGYLFRPAGPAGYAGIGRGGRLYPFEGVGLSLALAPAFLLAERIGRLVPASLLARVRSDPARACRDLLSLAMALLYGWTAVLTLRVARRVTGRSDGLAWPVLLAFATPPLLCLSFVVFAEIPAAWLCSWFAAEAVRPRPRRQVLLLPLALLPWIHLRYAVVSIVGLVWLAAGGRHGPHVSRRLAWSLPIPLVSAALFAGTDWAWFDSLASIKQFGQTLSLAPLPWARGVVGLLLDPYHGLLVVAPFWSLVLVGAGRLRCLRRDYIGLAAAVFVAVWLEAGSHRNWWGGASPPARFLVPALPLLVPLLAEGLRALRPRRSGWLVYASVGWAVVMTASLLAQPERQWSDPRRGVGLVASLLGATPATDGPGLAAAPNGANPFGESALMIAVRSHQRGAVEALLDDGVPIDAKTHTGRTALAFAVGAGDLDAAARLIRAGADVDAADRDGWTPLMTAARSGRLDLVRALLEAGADANAMSALGWTPLMWAAREGHLEAARVLVGAGADPNQASKAGRTALVQALRAGYPAIARLLVGAGAGLVDPVDQVVLWPPRALTPRSAPARGAGRVRP